MVILFALTLFVSSSLLFLVQPMFARMVLPMLGGTPAVWNTCVVFFQAALLAGYAYAHGSTAWLGVRRQIVLHSLLVLAAALFLPIGVASGWLPPTDRTPIPWLLGLMLLSVGVPFFVVSTTAPLLQKWFSATRHRAAGDPYFLYAASNLGSMLALLSYPFLLEPTLALRHQSILWAVGYGALAAMMIACAAVTWRQAAPSTSADLPDAPDVRPAVGPSPRGMQRLKWIALAAVPSSLMLGVTTYVSTDIAAVPLLWIVPLALYLLTFIVAFAASAPWLSGMANRALPLLVLPLVLVMVLQANSPAWLVIPLHLATFFVAALVCHLELAKSRPPIRHLTEFYLLISVGGLLGGVFNSLVAPHVFLGIAEYPIALIIACLLSPSVLQTTPIRPLAHSGWLRVAIVAVVSTTVMILVQRLWINDALLLASLSAAAILAFSLSRQPVYFGSAVGVMLVAGLLYSGGRGTVLHLERTFFGVHKVTTDAGGRFRSLYHGTTLHGRQNLDSTSGEPLTYYHRTGPIGQVFTALADQLHSGHVGIVGLGTGSLAAYASAGQDWTLYEIDPAIVRIAQNSQYFTYMRDAATNLKVVLGDARLSLANAAPGTFDLLVIDAFSSDAIPMHLMTSESLALYKRVLAVNGVLAFHISNRHLTLGPVLARLAEVHHLTALSQFDRITREDADMGKTASEWLVMAQDPESLRNLCQDPRWASPVADPSTPVWTDDFSNILSVLTPSSPFR